ncbi:MAG: hypothetical protein DRI70_09500 [Bacteroidetes bacterium]|nr:MAG: hypothetical protein DRI70_09500 [Bacteroidota bacterium]
MYNAILIYPFIDLLLSFCACTHRHEGQDNGDRKNLHCIPGKHGTTFGGNPLACAAALAAIAFMEKEDLSTQAKDKGNYFAEKFPADELEIVKELRYSGLMIGIELKEESKPFIKKLQTMGVLAIPAGVKVLRLLPPITISYEELDEVIEKIVLVLNQ